MREMDCGLWQGLRIKDIKKRYCRAYRQWRTDPTSICPPEGERVEDAWARVTKALETISRKNKTKTVALVAAPIVGALVECVLTAKPVERLWEIIDQAAAVREFTMNGSSGQLPATEVGL